MKALLALILAAALSSAAHSAIISFPNNPILPPPPPNSSVIAGNFVDTGFRFSPSCHLDFLYTMDCRGDADMQNPNPIGPTFGEIASLYIDFFGKPFSLISLRNAEPFDDGEGGFFPRGNMDLHSSKGGFVSFFTDPTEMFFTGDEWRNITWLVIAARDFASPAQGASNFVVSIPEPAPLTLIGIALVGLAFIRRRPMSIA